MEVYKVFVIRRKVSTICSFLISQLLPVCSIEVDGEDMPFHGGRFCGLIIDHFISFINTIEISYVSIRFRDFILQGSIHFIKIQLMESFLLTRPDKMRAEE